MVKYNIDRKIRILDIPKIIFNNKKPKELLGQWFPKKEIVFTNYGRSAFELILEAYEIKDCKVMIPAFICPLFIEIFKKRNIRPVLIDVDIKTFNITPKTLKKGFDKDAKCLIVNNMNGLPCEVEKLKKICKGMLIIEDCAHCFGAVHNGRKIGSFGDAAFFSFYKNLPTISGGFGVANKKIRTPVRERIDSYTLKRLIYYLGNNANIYRYFAKAKNAGSDLDFEKVKVSGPNKIVKGLFSKYIFDVDEVISRRKVIAKKMIKGLENCGLEFQEDPKNEHIYTYFSFLLPKKGLIGRRKFIERLQSKGIFPRVIWENPLSKVLDSKKCEVSSEISNRIVSIPIERGYTQKDIDYIVRAIKESL
jgi:dTDP-4-amino-4,6-dideoxygalactose transaminase